MPLKSVSCEIRLTSLVSAWNSTFRKPRSVLPRLPDEAWIARTFMRVRMSDTVLMAPSAIWSIEFAWPALTTACFRPWTSEFIREPIAIEAASSRAETTRLPIDSLASELLASMSVLSRLRWATSAA